MGKAWHLIMVRLTHCNLHLCVFLIKFFVLSHDNLTFYHFYFIPCAPLMSPSSPFPLIAHLDPPPLLTRSLGGACCVKV